MHEVWLSLDAIFALVGLVIGIGLHKWFTERKVGGKPRGTSKTSARPLS